MNILLLGASGRLGSAMTRLFPNHTYFTPNFTELDITKKDAVDQYVDGLEKLDLIINCAAYNNVDGAEGEGKELAFALNADAPEYLAEASKNRNVPFIQFSTDYVFSGTIGRMYAEEDITDPVSVYGESKAFGESRALATNPQTYIVRTSRLFGPAGTAIESKPSFSELIKKISSTQDYFSMNPFEVGSPTSVDDLSRHVFEHTVVVANRPAPGIYHATNSGWCTFYEWAHLVLEATHSKALMIPRDPRLETDTRAAKRPVCAVLSSTKLPPMRDWKEAVLDDLKTV